MEGNLWWKTSFDGRQFLMEDNFWRRLRDLETQKILWTKNFVQTSTFFWNHYFILPIFFEQWFFLYDIFFYNFFFFKSNFFFRSKIFSVAKKICYLKQTKIQLPIPLLEHSMILNKVIYFVDRSLDSKVAEQGQTGSKRAKLSCIGQNLAQESQIAPSGPKWG